MSSLKNKLVTERSNLRNLKFGSDRPGGGSSKQPFVKQPLPGVLEDNPNVGLLGGAGDFIGLRQGTFLRTADDVDRLGTFLLGTTQGAAFITKQNLLSLTNVKSVGQSIINQGAYVPTSTLAQVGVAGIGGHLLKQGLNPFKNTQEGGESSDPSVFQKISDFVLGGVTGPLELPLYQSHLEEIKNPDTNRLVTLKNTKLSNTEPESFNLPDISGILQDVLGGGSFSLDILKPNNENELFSYSGGPNSILGVGKTILRRYSNSEEGLNTYTPGSFKLKGSPAVKKVDTEDLTNIFGDDINIPISRGNLGSGFDVPETIIPGKPAEPGQYVPSKYDITKDHKSLDTKALGVTPKYASQNPESEAELTEGFSQDSVKTASPTETPNTLSRSQLKSQTSSEFNPQIKKDFRKDVANDNEGSIISKSLPYTDPKPGEKIGRFTTNQRIEGRVNLGNPGGKGNRSSYVKGKRDQSGKEIIADKINALQIYQSSNVIQNNTKNDLCDFRISVIDPNNIIRNQDTNDDDVINELDEGVFAQTFLHFRAFINSFTDNMNAEWQGERYMGRGENFYRYGGFDRTIDMSFTAAAQSKGEMMPMYNKLNYLQSVMAPNYTPAGYYFGNIIKLHVGAYLYDVPGVLTNLTYTIPQEAPWEIAVGDEDERAQNKGNIQVLPHIIDVNLSFKPIHQFAPKLQSNTFVGPDTAKRVGSFGKERFISLSRGFNEGYDSVDGVDPNSGFEIAKKEAKVSNVKEPTRVGPVSTVNDISNLSNRLSRSERESAALDRLMGTG